MLNLSLGLYLTGRNGLSNRVRIVVADDGVTPAMADVESGDTIADAFPATSLDTANYEVVGDETDSILYVTREWSLNGEEWQTVESDLAAIVAADGSAGWFDPSDLSTIFQDSAGTTAITADGDPTGLFQDKSGNGYHYSQSTAAARPTYKTDGTYHWIQSDGVDDTLTALHRFGLAANPNLTVSVAVEAISVATFDTLLTIGSGTGNLGIGLDGTGQGWKFSGGNAYFGAVSTGTPVVLSYVRSAGSTYAASRGFLNSVERSQTSVANPTGVPTQTGAVSAMIPDDTPNVKIFGMVVQNTADSSKREAAEAWLAGKCGVTL